MVNLNRVRIGWTGFPGQPGLTTFYMADGTLDVSPFKTFLTNMNLYVPSSIVWTIPAVGDKISVETGEITGAWAGVGGGSVNGFGGSTSYSQSSGICVDWLTGTLNNRRRIQGRTFFVPAAQSAYQTDGTIQESIRTTIQGYGNTLIASMLSGWQIWSRPFAGRAQVGTPGQPGYKPAVPARPGASGAPLTCRVPDIAAVMRSRR
jgi:hypothetical protein